MGVLSKLRAVAGAVPRAHVRRQANKFLAATRDCRKVQHDVLRRLIALNVESDFSRDHRLDQVRSVDDFRRHLPVADYSAFSPYIERMKRGDHHALLGRHNRLLMFTLSSGTTAQSKFIPITQRFVDDYRRGWQIWGIRTLDDHPAINSRHILQISSDFDRYRTPGGTPCGNISGLVAAMQKRIVRSMYSVPGIVSKIDDSLSKQYATVRLAVADAEVALVTTANPSTLIQLAQLVETAQEELIRDIADGTLSRRYSVSAGIRRELGPRIAPKRPARARQLERILESTGRLLPRDYWPDLQVVAVWTGGSVGAYLPSLRGLIGDVAVRDHGLSASEGRMTIPLEDELPDGVLDVTTHFFEFIPEEEYESENPAVLQAHELEEGRNYYILLTTSSGLYRYNICDVVCCTGYYRSTPLLKFLHKGAHISNITGEKVSESQVVTAVRACLESLGLHLRHFTISPVWGDPPRYRLLAEEHDVRSPEVGLGLARQVDEELQQLNCEYHDKRRSGRLGNLDFLPLPDGTWSRFTRQRQSRLGGSLEQYKHPCLVPELDFCAKLLHGNGRPKQDGRPEQTARKVASVAGNPR